jgi:hypothetical protein
MAIKAFNINITDCRLVKIFMTERLKKIFGKIKLFLSLLALDAIIFRITSASNEDCHLQAVLSL